jgi:septal ring factor EnvC (AmiA/AmiB activator)
MKSIFVYLLIAAALGLAALSFFQNKKIRNLREIQKNYEALTENFAELSKNYKSTLLKYQEIKTSHDQTTVSLDSISQRLDSVNRQSTLLIASAHANIVGIIQEVDTLELDDVETIRSLRTLLNEK